MADKAWAALTVACTVVLALTLDGCKKEQHAEPQAGTAGVAGAASSPTLGPATSPVEPTLDQGWCAGHGVPESVCTRCNNSLVPAFKQAGDWCAEHGLPESQCFVCHPEVEAEWARLNPAARKQRSGNAEGAPGQERRSGPSASAAEPTLAAGWCNGHGVPESVCTRCNGSLIPTFKQAGDWCAEHGLPESQCFVCHPEAEAEWAKLNPAAPRQDPSAGGTRRRDVQSAPGDARAQASADVRVERTSRLLTGSSDPLCPIENVRVRFIDQDIVHKAGITVERIQRRRMSANLAVPAEVEFDATRLTRITPRLAGVVLDVDVNVGDEVENGGLLAVIDSPVLGDAKSHFIEVSQDLRLAEADLDRAATIFSGAHRMLDVCTPQADPDRVRQALANSPVGEAKASLLRAHAALLLARAEAARQETLQEKQLGSDRDYQAAQSSLAAAEADFVAIKEEIAFGITRRRLAAERAVQIARTALESAGRRLRILGLSEEQVGMIGTEPDGMLSRFELRTLAVGHILERRVAVGESVGADDVLFVVADTSTMWLMADLYERDVLQMRLGLPVFFTVDGMPGAGFEGRVTWISRQVDPRTRTVQVRADMPNPQGLLRARMFGQANIVLRDNEEVITVPTQAVQTDGCCQLVFVKESDTVYQPRKVVLGASTDGIMEVLSGLQEDEMVASVGSFLMKTEILKSNIGAGCCEVDPGR